jgi:hypothetical protein
MSKHDQQTHDQFADDVSEFEPTDPTDGPGDQNINATAATVATVAVVAAGALVFEAALIPGIALGVAAMLVPRYLPQIGGALDPLVKSAVRVGRKTRELVGRGGRARPRYGRRGQRRGSTDAREARRAFKLTVP